MDWNHDLVLSQIVSTGRALVILSTYAYLRGDMKQQYCDPARALPTSLSSSKALNHGLSGGFPDDRCFNRAV